MKRFPHTVEYWRVQMAVQKGSSDVKELKKHMAENPNEFRLLPCAQDERTNDWHIEQAQKILGQNFSKGYITTKETILQMGQEKGRIGYFYVLCPQADAVLAVCHLLCCHDPREGFVLRTAVRDDLHSLGLTSLMYSKMAEELEQKNQIKSLISTVPIFAKNAFLNFRKIRAKILNLELREITAAGLRVEKFRIRRDINILKNLLQKDAWSEPAVPFKYGDKEVIRVEKICSALPNLSAVDMCLVGEKNFKQEIAAKNTDGANNFQAELLTNKKITEVATLQNFFIELPLDPNWSENIEQSKKIQLSVKFLFDFFWSKGFKTDNYCSKAEYQNKAYLVYRFFRPTSSFSVN